jgi:glycosyltransferase involved in cell wall biosynthesis
MPMRCPPLNEPPSPPPGKLGWPWTEASPQLPDTMPDGSPWPRVSVVTPSFNQGQFIEETIRSVLLQGYPDLEYIIIDGGSTDASVEIIRKYAPWLAYWVSEPDLGQANAVNKGWRRSSGEWLAYLNSDDTLAPSTLAHVAQTGLSNLQAAVIYGDCHLVDGAGRLLSELRSPAYDRAALFPTNYISQSSTFIRRFAVEQFGLLDESFYMTMDYEYWIRLAMSQCAMVHLPRVLSSARLTANTKTGRQALLYMGETLRVLDAVYRRPRVPDDVHRVRRQAYGSVWRLGGVRYFDARMRGQAIRAMLMSLRWDPFPGWKPLAVTLAIILQAVPGVYWRSAHTLEKAIP